MPPIKYHSRSEFRREDADEAFTQFAEAAVVNFDESQALRPVEVAVPIGVEVDSFMFKLASSLVTAYGCNFAVVDARNAVSPGLADEEEEVPGPKYDKAVRRFMRYANKDLRRQRRLNGLGFAIVLEPDQIHPADHAVKTGILGTLVELQVPTLLVRESPPVDK